MDGDNPIDGNNAVIYIYNIYICIIYYIVLGCFSLVFAPFSGKTLRYS